MAELQAELDWKKINIVQMPFEFYSFALPDSSDALAPSQRITFQRDTSSKGAKVTEGAPPIKKGATFSLGFAEPPSSSEISSQQYLLKLENHLAILIQLESNAIQLKQYLASPYIGALRHRTNSLLDTVSQLQELVHLVTECQEQVLLAGPPLINIYIAGKCNHCPNIMNT